MMLNFQFKDESFLFKEIIQNELIIHARVTSRTYDFLNESIHQLGLSERTEYSGRDELAENGCIVDVFPRGVGLEDKGFVSIRLGNKMDYCLDGKGTVTIIDASKDKTYMKVYKTLPMFKNRYWTFQKLTSRQRLLRDSDDLLPDGILTLKIDLVLRMTDFSQESFLFKMTNENQLMTVCARATSRTYDFLDKSIHRPKKAEKTEYSGRDKLSTNGLHIEVFPNGCTDEDKGFISIAFINTKDFYIEGCIILSVIDASKNQRYTKLKSFPFPLSKYSISLISRYISREALIRERNELLPDDTLTLRIDSQLRMVEDIIFEDESFIREDTCENNSSIYARVISRTRDFLKDSIHQTVMIRKTEYSGREELFAKGCLLDIYPDGSGDEDKGFVSMSLLNITDFAFQGSCNVSIINASKNEEYSTSFDFFPMFPPVKIDKYISRELLIRDRDALLPNDTLTLRIDLCLRQMKSCLPLTSPTDVVQVTLTTRMHNFLNEPTSTKTSDSPSDVETVYSEQEELLKIGVRLQVSVDENEDAVFIILHRTRRHDGFLQVSVVDASENQRFPRTFTFSFDMPPDTYREKYISRKRLMSDADDFLPNGTLTLLIEAQFTPRTLSIFPLIENIDEINASIHFSGDSFGLILDSPFAKRLAEKSAEFCALMQRTIDQEITKTMPIRENEVEAFMYIFQLLSKFGSPMLFPSIKKVFDLYIQADIYNIGIVIETCKCFLKLYASVHTIDALLECVGIYSDENLRDLLVNLIDLIRQTNFAAEIDQTHSDFVCLKQPISECLWIYINTGDSSRIIFSDKSAASKYNLIDEEKKYHFYE